MKDKLSFIYEESGGPYDSEEARALRGYKNKLEMMRKMFLSEPDVNVRKLTSINIDMLIRDLRSIVGGIEGLRRSPHIKKLLPSPDAAQTRIRRVITCFLFIADLLEMGKTPRNRELLYQKYEELPELISEAIDLFRKNKFLTND